MHEIAEFLHTTPPFDALDREQLAAVANACTIEFFAAGTVILAQGAGPAEEAYVVRRGGVELLDEGRLVDVLGAGEMFGHMSVLSSNPTAFSVRAQEDTLCYVIPAAALRPALARPAGLRYVVQSIGGRFEMRAREAASQASEDPSRRAVGDLVRTPAVVCGPDATVQQAAARMAEAAASSVLVDLGDSLGIVTDRDLRTRVVAAGAPPHTRLSEVMTAPARTVTADMPGADVLLEMLDRGVRHFPVLDVRRRLVGVISDTDLMSIEARTPFHLRSALMRAGDQTALGEAISDLPRTVVALHDARVSTDAVCRVITSVQDALVRRVIELTEAEVGAPPVPYTWFALGSLARREAFPSSDHDSALAWDGDDADADLRRWMRALAGRVVERLDASGTRPCAEGVVASRPLFSRSIDEWARVERSWVEDPGQEKAVILISVMLDARPVWGESVAGRRLSRPFERAPDHPRTLAFMRRLALARRPPTGFVRDFVVEADGEHAGRLDIKRGGMLPIADLARYFALAAGVSLATTATRLEAAVAAGTVEADDAGSLQDANELFADLRMRHQVEQLRAGRRPDDHVDPRALTPLTRTHLKAAFRAVARIQRRLAAQSELER